MVANGVEFDLGEAGGGKGGNKLGLEFGILEARSFLRGDLDEGLFTEVADANDPEAVAADGLFGLFDRGEAVECDGETGGQAGGEAGRGWFFGDFQSGFPGESADIGLGKAGIPEWGGHGEFARGGAAGSDFAGVIEIFPVGENGDAAEPGQLLHPLKELRAAEIAAVRRVGGVRRIFQFQSVKNLDRERMPLGKSESGGVFGTGEAGGVAEDAGDFGAEKLVGGPKEKSGVDPAGVGNEGRWPNSNEFMQPLFFGR